MYLKNLNVTYNDNLHSVRLGMSPVGRPCFNLELLSDIKHVQNTLDTELYPFVIIASDLQGIFNMGGDLDVFTHLIKNQDRDQLTEYMKLCIDVLLPKNSLESRFHRVALVQGSALGGGFEAALSCDYIIAEQHATFGFPEILFNLFPGMGAYSFLSRRTTPSIADRIIASKKTYTATEMLELNIIDKIVETGQGQKEVENYMAHFYKRFNAFKSINQVKKINDNIRYEELYEIGKIWVDTALELTTKNLKLMERLVKRQNKYIKSGNQPELEIKG